jgi:hypothetical protein
MPATFTFTRRDLSIALTITLPAAASCAALVAALTSTRHAPVTHSVAGAPTIALVQPVAGGAVPRDRPVVGFRYASSTEADPIDIGSFAVSVDGVDRTPAFTLSPSEGWGALPSGEGRDGLSLGSHSIEARICSVRGACARVASAILVERGIRR